MNIYYLIDSSGSMEERKLQVVDGLNEFLDTQRSMTSIISMYTFSNTIETVFEKESIVNIRRFENDQYQPHGSTSLYDALGILLEEKMEWNTKNILIVLTDGEDNSSYKYTIYRIRQLLKEHEDLLEMVFVGSNQRDILFPEESILEYEDHHLDRAMRITSDALKRYQTQTTPNIQFTALEREKTMEY